MDISRNFFSEQIIDGNHSVRYTKYIIEYSHNLSQKKLPIIFSTKHLALLLGLEFKTLKSIIGKRSIQYQFYEISKKRGGKRQISVPHKDLKYIQSWITENILNKVPVHNNIHGFVKGKSILSNAVNHLDAECILNIDLKKFFDSIEEKRVYSLFKFLGYHSNLAVDMAKLCTCPISEKYYETFSDDDKLLFQDIFQNKKAVLPQGAPSSPAISNLICSRLDKRMIGYSEKHNLKYTRYADDITFSGSFSKMPKINFIKKVVKEENLKINWDKVRYYKKGQLQMVTGLLIDNKIRVPKKFKKEINRHLYFCKKYSAESHFNYLSEKHDNKKGFQKDWLLGKIRYVYSIEPEEGMKMFKKFNEITWWI